jgi:transcriptional regulator with XRE-family HTH domain
MELDQVVLTEWLRTGMQARGMTQRQLAMQSGVDHSTISRILSGDRSAAWATVLRLAVALGEPLPVPDDPSYHPSAVARVERALRADSAIEDRDRERLVRMYLDIRAKRANPLGAGARTAPHGARAGPRGTPSVVAHPPGRSTATVGRGEGEAPTRRNRPLARTIAAWSDAERELRRVSAAHPDNEAARQLCRTLHDLVEGVTSGTIPGTARTIALGDAAVRASRHLLERTPD